MARTDHEAEAALLGAILVSNQVLTRAVADEGLHADHFDNGWHRRVFAAMQALSDRQAPIDEVTLVAEIGRGDDVVARVNRLAGPVPNVANFRAYARRVIEVARWRQLDRAAVLLHEAALDEDEGKVADAERLMTPDDVPQVRESVTSRTFDYLSKSGQAGVPWPFVKLNQIANGGMMAGESTLLSAWTSSGKSILADGILHHAVSKGFTGRLYINEGKDVFRVLRNVARQTGIPYRKLRSRDLTLQEATKATEFLGQGLPFEVVDVRGWDAPRIARDIRFHPADVTVLDILHEIRHDTERDLASIWTTLKAAAGDTHLVATAHLNQARAVSEKPPPPQIRDIRGSGMLANGSDFVLFVHRDWDMVDGHAEMTREGGVWFAKTREGELGGLRVVLNAQRMQFTAALT